MKPYRVWGEIYAIGGGELSHPYDCSVYLLGGVELIKRLFIIEGRMLNSPGRIVQACFHSVGFYEGIFLEGNIPGK